MRSPRSMSAIEAFPELPAGLHDPAVQTGLERDTSDSKGYG